MHRKCIWGNLTFLRQKIRHVAHWIDWKKSKYYNKICTEKSDTYACPVCIYTILWKTLFDDFSWVIFLYLLCHFFPTEIAVNFTKLGALLRQKNLNLKINTVMPLTYNHAEVALFDKCSNFKLMNWVARTWVHKNHIFSCSHLILPYNQHFIFFPPLSF